MKILSEREEKFTIMDCDFEDEEWDMLLSYANVHMPKETLEGLKIEWAMIEALKSSIKEFENKAQGELFE